MSRVEGRGVGCFDDFLFFLPLFSPKTFDSIAVCKLSICARLEDGRFMM